MTGVPDEINLRRAALAVPAGAICGAVVITALMLRPLLRSARTWIDAAEIAGFLLSIHFVLFVVGLLVVATPGWWLLHKMGQRGYIQAATYGATLTLVSYLAYSQFSRYVLLKSFYGPAPIVWELGVNRWPAWRSWSIALMLFEGAIWYSIVGGLVGLLIWRLAYRPYVAGLADAAK